MSPKATTRKSSAMPIYAVALLLIIAVAAFYGGVQYQKGKSNKTLSSSNTAANTGQRFGGGGGGFGSRFGGVRPTFGQVTAISPTSISVQDSRSGSIVTLSITSSTTITNAGQSASVDSIQTGNTVAVIASSTDSSQASRILINPTFGGSSGNGGGSPGSSAL